MNKKKDVYIEMETYTRVDQANSRYQSKRTASLYRYSNYTGFIDSVGPETWEYDYSGLYNEKYNTMVNTNINSVAFIVNSILLVYGT